MDRFRTADPVSRDGGRPYGVALQGEVSNHRELRRSKAGVVSVAERRAESVSGVS